MKLIPMLFGVTFSTLAAAPLLAAGEDNGRSGCLTKKEQIAAKIEVVRASGNISQLSGLETALRETTENCTEASLRVERQNKVLKARQEVVERRADLDKATQKGDVEKIARRKEKLAESLDELQAAMAALNS